MSELCRALHLLHVWKVMCDDACGWVRDVGWSGPRCTASTAYAWPKFSRCQPQFHNAHEGVTHKVRSGVFYIDMAPATPVPQSLPYQPPQRFRA